MYTSIFPFKKVTTDSDSRKHEIYWAAIDSPDIQRVLAFGDIDRLKLFLEKGAVENGTTVDIRPYTLVRLDYGAFASEKKPLFGFAKKSSQITSLLDYPSWLLDSIRGGEPLKTEDFAKCSFYMGFDKAQVVAEGLEARLHQRFSQEERNHLIDMIGSIPIKNGLKNETSPEKQNGAYITLPNIQLHDLVNLYARSLSGLPNGVPKDLINTYLFSLAENDAKPNNESPYIMTSLVEEDTKPDKRSSHEKARDYFLASERFNRMVMDALLRNGKSPNANNSRIHESGLSEHHHERQTP